MSQTQTVTETVSVWAPTEKGANLNPKWWKPAATLRHPRLPKPPTAKTEPSEWYQLRLSKALEEYRTDIICGPMFGRDAGQGYYFVATDGSRALLRRGIATKEGPPAKGQWLVTGEHAEVPLPGDFYAACKRVLTCVPERNKSACIDIGNTDQDRSARRITVYSNGDFDSVLYASEWCALHTEREPTATAKPITINLEYLIDGLGRPSLLYYKPANPHAAIIIQAEDGETRYVLMPMRLLR